MASTGTRPRPTVLNLVAAYGVMVCGAVLSVAGFHDGNPLLGVVGLLQAAAGAYSVWWTTRERRRLR